MSKTIFEILKPLFDKDTKEFKCYKLPNLVVNWPEVEYDGRMETLDLENHEFISINDKEFKMASGGDWQDPLTFTMVPDGNKLKVIYSTKSFKDGMIYDDFIRILEKNID